jgi:hypothetical protein
VEAKSPATGIVGAADRIVGNLGEVQNLRRHQEKRGQGKLRHRGHIRCRCSDDDEAKKGTMQGSRLVCPETDNSYSIADLRGDRRVNGETVYGLRMWENADLVPRPDDVFQERLYCVRWAVPDLASLLHGEQRVLWSSATDEAKLCYYGVRIDGLKEFLHENDQEILQNLRARNWTEENDALQNAKTNLAVEKAAKAAKNILDKLVDRVRELSVVIAKRQGDVDRLASRIPGRVYTGPYDRRHLQRGQGTAIGQGELRRLASQGLPAQHAHTTRGRDDAAVP